jgi:hypothetical protein
MKRASAVAYHGLSLLALLAHLYLVVIVLVTLILTVPAGMELPGLLLKATVAIGWVALLALGLLLWLQRRWLVLGVPIVALVGLAVINAIGQEWIGWSLNWGY